MQKFQQKNCYLFVDKINTILSSFRDFDNLNCFSDYIPFLNSNHFYGAEINKFECYAFQYYLLGDYAKAKNYFKKIINFENGLPPYYKYLVIFARISGFVLISILVASFGGLWKGRNNAFRPPLPVSALLWSPKRNRRNRPP